jgi:hypothetical protein
VNTRSQSQANDIPEPLRAYPAVRVLPGCRYLAWMDLFGGRARLLVGRLDDPFTYDLGY